MTATSLLAALAASCALAVAGMPPSRRLSGEATRRGGPKVPRDGPGPVDRHRLASDISLFASCFAAGLPAQDAAAVVAESYGEQAAGEPLADKWRTAAALTGLSVEPERAWEAFHDVPKGTDLASVVAASHASGTAVAAGCERIADELKAAAADDATAKAERAGVLIAIPLTAFFLPAFFILGLIPTAISLGSHLM